METEDDTFLDPEDVKGTESDNLLDAVTEDPEDPEEQEEEEEEEEDDDDIFSNWLSRYKATEQAKDKEKDEGEDNADMFDRKSSLDPPARPRADRRASLPCPAQLSAMQLSRLYNATKPPTPVRGHIRTRISSCEDSCPARPACPERRPSVITTIPEVAELPERKTRFRRRNVMSLSDADRVCLICHDDLNKGASGIEELHCSHSFHSECIEEWLWRKQSCPTCRVQVPMPEPLYWSSARVKVP
ncbi:E3 ubiquitin-protein ligase SIRP1 [Hypomesus transpacificus]|uniref:E3 ubiquitin-protein ligase SIRP1 n=1 Tax=Hypomesus transpacificus TaxID=137520 RepID=UPI001F081E79|nr:E3 ubiquitin-protein ligase SIRP1 [Hypomesus transpacificus]